MTIMLQTTPQTDPAALTRRPDPAGPLAVATPTTRRRADASISVNTRRAYAGALARQPQKSYWPARWCDEHNLVGSAAFGCIKGPSGAGKTEIPDFLIPFPR